MINIFTDGASRGNPGPGGWGAVIVDDLASTSHIVELGGSESHTTNNRMEITAAIRALQNLASQSGQSSDSIIIHTDSSYLINGITKWVHGWQKKGWISTKKEEVMNRDLWEELVEAVAGRKIEWKYVGGHSGVIGNERCDVIATGFADNNVKPGDVNLYNGPLSGYPIQNILDISIDESKAKIKSADKSRSRAKAYSYISAIDGKVMIHQSWAECEARVKGKSGARFKKALSPTEESLIVADFKL